ncbi:MAG: tetratricopeptide repeat protein [Arenicellales bacterium]|nr:tetratricopeptide repeat protein [Arenicellales bacterium]
MDEKLYSFLKYTAIGMVVAWVGWSFYDSFFASQSPGQNAYITGDKFFEDGDYLRALEEYEVALTQEPDAPYLARAKARALMQLGRNEEALAWFDRAVILQPFFGGTYANRGILYDRLGQYELAIADYEKALQLDEEIGEGPNWLTRFLRKQPEKPPTVKERLEYLKVELAKPEEERLLRVPEIDEQQRTYKQ